MVERKEQTKTPVKAEDKAVIKWKGEKITVTFHDVKNLICPLATDQETAIFLKTCQSLQLNPFAKEIYLIKYAERDKAATVIAIESYWKAAEMNDNYNGSEAGIILKEAPGKFEFREGAFLLEEELDKLVGGWARVYRKNRDRPAYVAVNLKECIKYTKEGKPTQFWAKEKQASMVRKTALKRALVEAFPSLFADIISTAEMADVPQAEYERIPEGELPPAYERNGEPYWRLWWVRQKEKGLDEEDVHDILSVTSVKEDWLGTGRTLEEAEDIINQALPVVTSAKALSLSINQVNNMLGMTLKEWFAQGKTEDDAAKMLAEKLAKPKVGVTTPAKEETAVAVTPPEAAFIGDAEETGISIDSQWLKEARQALKWTETTMLSFIISQYKVSGKSVTEVLNKLTRPDAEDFVKQINKRLEKQMGWF